MPYDPGATSELTLRYDNQRDFENAPLGKWFIGVIDTQQKKVFIVPVNVFEGRGQLDQNTLNNTGRGLNRYASGTEADRAGTPQASRTFGALNSSAPTKNEPSVLTSGVPDLEQDVDECWTRV
jgi:hypothetical protein